MPHAHTQTHEHTRFLTSSLLPEVHCFEVHLNGTIWTKSLNKQDDLNSSLIQHDNMSPIPSQLVRLLKEDIDEFCFYAVIETDEVGK